MLVAYRGYSVILFAPLAAMAASCSPIPRGRRRVHRRFSWREWSGS